MYYTYIIQSTSNGKFYIGSTENVSIRLSQHNAGKVTSTKDHLPWQLVYSEAFATRSEAVRREREIKGWKNPDYMTWKLRIK